MGVVSHGYRGLGGGRDGCGCWDKARGVGRMSGMPEHFHRVRCRH